MISCGLGKTKEALLKFCTETLDSNLGVENESDDNTDSEEEAEDVPA